MADEYNIPPAIPVLYWDTLDTDPKLHANDRRVRDVGGVPCVLVPTAPAWSDAVRDLSTALGNDAGACGLCPVRHRGSATVDDCATTPCGGGVCVPVELLPVLALRGAS